MRLALIGDELEVRWTLPRLAHLPWMAMYRYLPPRPRFVRPPRPPTAGPQCQDVWMGPMVVPESPVETYDATSPRGLRPHGMLRVGTENPYWRPGPKGCGPLASGRQSLGEPRPVSSFSGGRMCPHGTRLFGLWPGGFSMWPLRGQAGIGGDDTQTGSQVN